MKYKFFQYFQTSIYILFIWLLTACANMPIQPLTPQVSLTDFKIVKLGLSEQSYRLRLRLNNTNSFPLPIMGIDYRLYINEREFTHGTTEQLIAIPAKGEQFIDLDIVSNLMYIIGQWSDFKTVVNRKFNYRLAGGLKIVDWAPLFPFEYRGEIPLVWGEKPNTYDDNADNASDNNNGKADDNADKTSDNNNGTADDNADQASDKI